MHNIIAASFILTASVGAQATTCTKLNENLVWENDSTINFEKGMKESIQILRSQGILKPAQIDELEQRNAQMIHHMKAVYNQHRAEYLQTCH